MNIKLHVLSAGVLFFLGQAVSAQKVKKDTAKMTQIDEVVVMGYQKKSKDLVTQAVSVVGGEELKALAPSGSLVNMLQGKASGLQVINNSGKPGEPGSIRIRGTVNVSTTLGATDPLFVVDGMYMTQRQFNVIPASDIENITILKDAAAAAIYGSRAGNGVVLVTTKRGTSGKARVTFESRFGFSQKAKDKNFTLMNASEKMTYENNLTGLGITSASAFNAEEFAEGLKNNHSWAKDILKNSNIQAYNVSISGGGEKNNYFISLGHDTDTGILEKLKGFKRYNARFNFMQKVSDRIRIFTDFAVVNTKTDDQRFAYNALSPFYGIYSYNPFEPVYLENGKLNPTSQGVSALDVLEGERTYDWRTRFSGQLAGEITLYDGLTFRSSFAGNYDLRKNKYVVRKGFDIASVYGTPDGQVRDIRSDFFTYVFNNKINYTKSFGNHNIGAYVFMEYSQEDFGNLSGTKRIMLDPYITDIGSLVTPFDITGNTISTRRISYAGSVDYNYDKKYIVTASIRRDGSSRFGTTKYGNFWGAAVAWNIAKEDFFQKLGVFDELKIRYSMGLRGNDASLTDYQNMVSVSSGDYGTYPTLSPSKEFGNADIGWEKIQSKNLGVEFEAVNRRFRGSLEIYQDKRNNFLYRLASTPYEGGGYSYSTFVNAGDIKVEGLEAELSADVIKMSKLTWTIYGNITSQKIETKKLYGNTTDLSSGDNLTYTYINGEPFTFKLVRDAGVDAQTGAALYYDANGNITTQYKTSDAVYLHGKSPVPSVYGGFGTTMKIYGFDLRADFSYQYGGYSYNQVAVDLLDFSGANTNKMTQANNYWTTPGQTAYLSKPVNSGIEQTDKFLQKTDFIRFRSLDVGYTFDKKLLNIDYIDSVRLFVQGQNLALWTKFMGDPENAVASESQVNNGVFVPGAQQLYNYPPVRTYLIGMQVNF